MEAKQNSAINIQDLHSPSSIINIFNNSLYTKEERKIVFLQGIYEKQGSRRYNSVFYDCLKDETGRKSLTVLVPEKIRSEFKDGYTYKVKGYLNRKVDDRGFIQINFYIIDIISNDGVRMSNEDLKKFDIRRKKDSQGYRNLDFLLEKKLHKKEVPNIAIIYGNESIIDEDINNAIGRTKYSYNIEEFRINLSSETEIIQQLAELNNEKYDCVVLTRGGGSGLEVFNDTNIAESILLMKPIFATAIGHAADVFLLQEIADKRFDTPTALGAYLKELAVRVGEEHKKEETRTREHEQEVMELKNSYLKLEEKMIEAGKQYELRIDKLRKNQIVLLIIGLLIGIILAKIKF